VIIEEIEDDGSLLKTPMAACMHAIITSWHGCLIEIMTDNLMLYNFQKILWILRVLNCFLYSYILGHLNFKIFKC